MIEGACGGTNSSKSGLHAWRRHVDIAIGSLDRDDPVLGLDRLPFGA